MFKNTDRALKVIAISIILVVGMTGIYAARGLYADGSYWLIEMLPRGGFYIFDSHRAYAQILVQAPVALALWLQVSDLNVLIRLHSLGSVGVPLLFWLVALLLHVRTKFFWFFLLAFSVSYLRSNFFAAGEFSSAYGLTALCTAILFQQKIGYVLAALLLVAAVALTRSYEATLLLGAFLVAVVTLRLMQMKNERMGVKLALVGSMLAFLFAVYLGANSVFFQRSYDGTGAANLGALREIHLLYLLLMPALAGALCTAYVRNRVRWEKTIVIVMVLLSGLYLLYSFRWDHSNISFGYLSYAYRGLCNFLLLGALSLAVAQRFFPRLFGVDSKVEPASYLSVVVIFFFLSMAYPLVYHSYGFYKWAQRFEAQAIALETHTPIDKTTINKNHGWTFSYNWPWGNPSTSILLRGNAGAVILNNSTHTGPEPIDLTRIEKNPLLPADLSGVAVGDQRLFQKRSLLYP